MIRFILSLSFATTAMAASKPSNIEAEKQSVKALVEKAVDYYHAHGKTAAFAEISKKDGSLHDHGHYVFVYDINGTMCAHGQFPGAVGGNYMRARDREGRLFIQERINLLKHTGEGFQNYVYMNPETKKYAEKTSYLKKIDDFYIFGSGFYGPDVKVDAANGQRPSVFILCSSD